MYEALTLAGPLTSSHLASFPFSFFFFFQVNGQIFLAFAFEFLSSKQLFVFYFGLATNQIRREIEVQATLIKGRNFLFSLLAVFKLA